MKQKLVKLLLIYMAVPVFSFAQTGGYKFYCQLDSIKVSGFYNIVLTPELTAHLKTDYSDLRIVNDSGEWVPHIVRFPNSEIGSEMTWTEMKIIHLQNSMAATNLIIENDRDTITRFTVKFKTTTAERFCTLTGSDDCKNWFIINDSILITPTQNEAESQFEIAFPPCNYKYYKLLINNKGQAPFNITKVCIPFMVQPNDKYFIHPLIENPVSSLQQKDSGKISYIKVMQNAPYHFGMIGIKVSGVKYFSRNVDMYIPDSSYSSFADPGQLITSFIISNNSPLMYEAKRNCNATVFYLLIHNDDNLPLRVDQVKTVAGYTVATAYLEKGDNYRLFLDNTNATPPDYDLSNLRFNRDSIIILGTGKIHAIETATIKLPTVKNNNWWIWPCIAAIITVLGLLTFRLSNEMKRSDN